MFWAQKPALSGEQLLGMLGKCTFEKSEFRAPKASFTAERHVWLTRLNNLRIVIDGITRPLNEHERQLVLTLPYQQAGDFTYKKLRSALVKAGRLPDSFRFSGLLYPSTAQQESGKAKDPESAALVKLPAWQGLHKKLKEHGLETEWRGLAGAAFSGNPDQLDEIARVLSVFKDSGEIEIELRALKLPGGTKSVQALLEMSFDKFHALSLKALRRIVPLMETGMRYDEAVAAIPEYGHHSQLQAPGGEHVRYLPPFYSERKDDGRMVFNEDLDVPRNPVVLRSLNQARKVVNAIIKKYGSPHAVHIEMARDLSRPLDERRNIEREQGEYRSRNEIVRNKFAELFGFEPKGREFEKYRLYEEQQGKCAYSGEALDIYRVIHDQTYAEIDHALPYSRSFDDSKNNKVLVLAKENRDKGNRTPYEFLDGKNGSAPWQRFLIFVENNKSYRLAKRTRLLRKDFGEKEASEFRERNLNDTRFICRFFKNYVERFLQLADGSDAKRCVVLSGQLTSFLRARWGLIKIRGDNDRHHALDAAIVAACSHGMVQRLSNHARRKELEKVREGFIDPATGEIPNPAMLAQLQEHFPEPWPHFRHELETRLKIDDRATLRAEVKRLGTYPPDELESLRPLFVSRAPQRRNSGAAHKDTIYAQPERLKEQGGVTQKVALSNLTLKDLDQLIDPHRNEKLYAAIRARLEEYGGKSEKAFASDKPFRKPDREGNPTGPVVRTVTKVIDKLSGIAVRGGIAKNDTMLRVDVFSKSSKYHLVPVYVHHATRPDLPNRAIVAFKDEADWTVIDDSFEWCFSLCPNDLVRIQQKGKDAILGYYGSCHRGTGNLNIWAHDRSQKIGKDGLIEGLGVKTAHSVEKFHVDILGNVYPAQPEPRRGLA